MLFGVLVAAAGLFLTVAPLTAARATARARFAPYSTDDKSIRYYRLNGIMIAAFGLGIALLA